MADDLSLLFRLRAQNQASPVIKSLQNDVQKLRQSTSADFTQINQVATASLGRITSSITNIASQVPILGNAVNALSGEMTGLAAGTSTASSGLAAMAGPLGIAAAGFIATAVAVEQLGTALFESAKSAADYQGKLFDLSQQTGVNVETLSALEIAASTTGGTIDSVAASLGIFQKNMVEADDASSKAAKTFADLGVTVTDTETTFSDTLAALAKMPEGFRQTNAALELFGRGGKQVLAIVKETNGDLNLLKERLRDAGLVTTEQARRADEFNDQLGLLGFQLRGLGTEIIPSVTSAVKDLSKFLKDNKEATEALKISIGLLATLFTGPFKGALLVAQTNIKAVTDALEFLRLKAKEPIIVGVELKGDKTSGGKLLEEVFKAGAPLGSTRGEITAAATQAGLIKATGGGQKADAGQQLLKSLTQELGNLSEQTKVQEVLTELLDKRFKNLNSELRSQIILAAGLIDTKREQLALDKEAEQAAEKETQRLKKSRDEGIAFFDAQVEQINKLKGIVPGAFDAARVAVGLFGEALTEQERELIRVNAAIIRALEASKALDDALNNIELTPGPTGGAPSTETPFLDLGLEDAPEAEKRIRDLQEAFDELGLSIGNVFGASDDFARDFGDVAMSAVNDLAQGVGSLVEQWVLLGDTGPDAMRKLTASVLAGVAAQAAVKAIFQLAEGFAALFFNPAEAAAHFTSAALFGSIAGVAAVAGRSVAGNLFKPNQGGGSRSTGSGQVNPLTLNRNQPDSTRTIVLQVQSNDSHIVKVVGANIREAGDLREIIFNDGVS